MQDPATHYRALTAHIAALSSQIQELQAKATQLATALDALALLSEAEDGAYRQHLASRKEATTRELDTKLAEKRECATALQAAQRSLGEELREAIAALVETGNAFLDRAEIRGDSGKRASSLEEMSENLKTAIELNALIEESRPGRDNEPTSSEQENRRLELAPKPETDPLAPPPLIRGLPAELSKFISGGKQGNSLKDFVRHHGEGIAALAAHFGGNLERIADELRRRGLNGGLLSMEQVVTLLREGLPEEPKPKPSAVLLPFQGAVPDGTARALPLRLQVRLPSGKLIAAHDSATTFLEALNAADIRKVRQLRMSLNGEPLVSDTPRGKYPRKLVGNHYVSTHSNTTTKQRILEAISLELDLGWVVEAVRPE